VKVLTYAAHNNEFTQELTQSVEEVYTMISRLAPSIIMEIPFCFEREEDMLGDEITKEFNKILRDVINSAKQFGKFADYFV
jgi:hypothetical protein